MMNTILVPIDFSPSASNAANYAMHLAEAFQCEILLFHVYHVPIPVSTGAPITALSGNELQSINEELLKKEADRLTSDSCIKVNIMANIGPVVHEILEQSKSASMIVMGMKGAGFIKENLIGSTTTTLMSRTDKPMVVVPEDALFSNPSNILLACDYDNHTKVDTLEYLQLFINAFNLKLYIVNVKSNKTLPALGDATEADLKEQKREQEPIFYFPENTDPVEGINSLAKEKKADIIALIPHHYHLPETLFHKSISRKMAFHTHVPLLILPEKQ